MKRNRKGKQKRLEEKRMQRSKRTKKKHPIVEWLTDTMFVLHFSDNAINNVFSSVTIEELDDDFEWPDEQTQITYEEIESKADENKKDTSDLLHIN